MKVAKLVTAGLVGSTIALALVGCAADSEGDEGGDQGSSALAAGGRSTAPPANTIMKVTPPGPSSSTGALHCKQDASSVNGCGPHHVCCGGVPGTPGYTGAPMCVPGDVCPL